MQKGDRLLEEIGWRMHFRTARAPTAVVALAALADPDPLWAPYLPRAS